MRLYSFAVKSQIRLDAELARCRTGRPPDRLERGPRGASLAQAQWRGNAGSHQQRLVFSVGITLEAGEVVTTGTPAGIGYFREPQIFLKPGDVGELEISGVGKLVNRVVADEYRFPQRFSQRKPNFTEDFVGKP